jgi:hypothetical protein
MYVGSRLPVLDCAGTWSSVVLSGWRCDDMRPMSALPARIAYMNFTPILRFWITNCRRRVALRLVQRSIQIRQEIIQRFKPD